jgi:outer membrane lipoprotein-sorting protein
VPSSLRGLLLAATIASSACAPALLKLPAPASPAADARDALAQAVAACSGVRTLSAELAVSGSVGGQSLRGRLLTGLAAPASARIEAVAPFGQPVFIFVARGDDATLLLPRDDRVLRHGRPESVLEALTGLALDAAALRRALTGCPNDADPESGRTAGNDWRVLADGPNAVYVRRDARSGPWHVAAIVHTSASQPDWRAEYQNVQNGLPRSVRLVSSDLRRFDLRLSVSQLETNTALGDEVFRVEVPSSAVPVSLEELRASGPLRESPAAAGRARP